MKKLTSVLIVFVLILAITGCGSKKAYEGEKTNESVQVDNANDSQEIKEIDENSAQQLVEERLDTTKYSAEKQDDITVDDENYYVYKILEGDTALSMGVAVNKISGELYAYKEDKTIAPYSEFTLYDESKDAQVDWEGTYTSEAATLELMPADANSFEFTLASKDGTDTITGAVQVNGNEAVYEEESGYKITFVNDNNSIVITESETNPSGNGTSFQGTYSK